MWHCLFLSMKLEQDIQLSLGEKSFLSRNSNLCCKLGLRFSGGISGLQQEQIFANPSSETLDLVWEHQVRTKPSEMLVKLIYS